MKIKIILIKNKTAFFKCDINAENINFNDKIIYNNHKNYKVFYNKKIIIYRLYIKIIITQTNKN